MQKLVYQDFLQNPYHIRKKYLFLHIQLKGNSKVTLRWVYDNTEETRIINVEKPPRKEKVFPLPPKIFFPSR